MMMEMMVHDSDASTLELKIGGHCVQFSPTSIFFLCIFSIQNIVKAVDVVDDVGGDVDAVDDAGEEFETRCQRCCR